MLQHFLLKISYSQNAFVLIQHHKVFIGQIWFQELKLSKLTEIWYRHTLLHPYFEFQVYFFKRFAIHIFLGKFGPIIWVSSNWLKFHSGVHCYMFTTILMLIFSKFCHSYNFSQILSQNLLSFKLTGIRYNGTLLHADYS